MSPRRRTDVAESDLPSAVLRVVGDTGIEARLGVVRLTAPEAALGSHALLKMACSVLDHGGTGPERIAIRVEALVAR